MSDEDIDCHITFMIDTTSHEFTHRLHDMYNTFLNGGRRPETAGYLDVYDTLTKELELFLENNIIDYKKTAVEEDRDIWNHYTISVHDLNLLRITYGNILKVI